MFFGRRRTQNPHHTRENTSGGSEFSHDNSSLQRIQASQPNPFSEEAIYHFCTAVLLILERDLHLAHRCAVNLVLEFSRNLRIQKEQAWPMIADLLEASGIRSRWNHTLAVERPSALASWILPYCRDSILDLLCGDGHVGERLALAGADVVLTERADSYSLVRAHPIPFIEFSELTTQTHWAKSFGTVLLCTVLHHELDPGVLVQLASNFANARLIIIENCLPPAESSESQLLLDLFFSQCLNSFNAPTVGNHKTTSEWQSVASFHGAVCVLERRGSLPGIPLSHDLIVVDHPIENSTI